ncbi:MAG: TetR family transcriptional regulator [Candidatus Nanopelagicales bacterium]|nr:TetR family transcriptional regulator [Candidatus Nanopelagicales bacterium]
MQRPAPRRRGPRAGAGEDTREAIVAAARVEFAQHGFAGTTLRSIAARAGVDPALIHHYFGTKMGLFQAVLALGVDPTRQALPAMLDGPREEAGQRIVRTFLTMYEDPQFREPVLAVMRTAMTSREVAALAASFLQDTMLRGLVTLAVGPDPARQVALAMTHLMGTVLGRHVLGLAALQGEVDALVDELAPVVQRYLDGAHRDVTGPVGS